MRPSRREEGDLVASYEANDARTALAAVPSPNGSTVPRAYRVF